MAWDEGSQSYVASGPSAVVERRGRKRGGGSGRCDLSMRCRSDVASRAVPEQGSGQGGGAGGDYVDAAAEGGDAQRTLEPVDSTMAAAGGLDLSETSLPHGAHVESDVGPVSKRPRLSRGASVDGSEDLEMHSADMEASGDCVLLARGDDWHDPDRDGRGWHRLDGARDPRDAPAHRPQPRLRVDPPATDEESPPLARRRCGPVDGADAAGSAWEGVGPIGLSSDRMGKSTVNGGRECSMAISSPVDPSLNLPSDTLW